METRSSRAYLIVCVKGTADDLIHKDAPEPERCHQRYAPAYSCHLHPSVFDGTFVGLAIGVNVFRGLA